MADFLVKLTQIGTSGTIQWETNFGFSFLADFRRDQTRLISGVTKKLITKNRVIELLSHCCGSKLYEDKRVVQNSQNFATVIPFYICGLCYTETIYPADFVVRQYSDFTEEVVSNLGNLINSSGIDPLEAFVIAHELTQVLEQVWTEVEAHRRVSEILAEKNEYKLF